MDAKALVALGRTDATKPAVIGNSVYDPLLFSRRLIHFSARQYLFLNSFRLGVSLEEAAQKSGMKTESAERFLKRKDVRAWMEDRAKQDYIKNEWSEPAKWWSEGQKVWTGEKKVDRQQIQVWQEFGRRIQPPNEANVPITLNLNINRDKVKKAFEREKAIETRIEADIRG